MVSKESTMLSSIEFPPQSFNPNARGYHAVYHDGEVNHCPGCGRTHWLIGRLSAECAFCSTALPLKEARPRARGGAGVLERYAPELRRAQRRLSLKISYLHIAAAGICSPRMRKSGAFPLWWHSSERLAGWPGHRGFRRSSTGPEPRFGELSIRRAGTQDWKPLGAHRRRERTASIESSRIRIARSTSAPIVGGSAR